MASNLPPGCTNAMIEAQFADRPCEVCGYYPDDCICPECPTCKEVGNPLCYIELTQPKELVGVPGLPVIEFHGLSLSLDQRIGRSKRRIEDLKDQIADEGMHLDWLESQKIEKEEIDHAVQQVPELP